MTYRVFISQPMTGRSLDEVKKERENVITIMHRFDTVLRTVGDSVEVVDSFDEKAFIEHRNPLECMGDCIRIMSTCNVVVFVPGWEKSRGCRIEHQCATEYRISTIMLKDITPHIGSQHSDTDMYNK